MHHKIPSRNKPRLLTVRMFIFNSKGDKVCIGKKTFDIRTLIEECIKHREVICVEE